MLTTKKQGAMQHNHIDDVMGGVFSIVSILMYILGQIDLNIEDVAAFLAVLSGSASLIINFPKLRKRIKDIFSKTKK